MGAYYNEHDPFAASWLRELIKAKLIADGEVDERSIELVSPDDLRGFVQCHFFAGIGGWSYALRLAGWSDDRPVWTGSCPCQPFSAAGKGDGAADPRHLWPAWFRLIRECRPATVFGEQVTSVDGLAWFDLVSTDLEGADYAVASADLCAAGVGAAHIRQRLWFVADAASTRSNDCGRGSAGAGRIQFEPVELCAAGELADTERSQLRTAGSGSLSSSQGTTETGTAEWQRLRDDARQRGTDGELGDSNVQGSQGRDLSAERARECAARQTGASGFWSNAIWIPCRDGKARPIEPGSFPLAYGVRNRVGLLRGYGNAIVPQVAQVFIQAYCDVSHGRIL